MRDSANYVILGGRKYFRTVAPILSKERWQAIEYLVKQSIVEDKELEFTLCVGSYEEIVRGKAYLFNESLQSFLVNCRVIMGKDIVTVNYVDKSDRELLEMEVQNDAFLQ
ncbi:hypothetical protein HCB27_14310 [Listeria booriae]|uniref:Uncharacterized protein n=1 Tax=Listeria booriae TaxID=1552123 RepID=A0A7X0Z8C8_9LIST|nr:hypothetical protein [Listeria booriae]MBC2177778.1 hypothetical protein [Listeria booriae]MBC2177801.1 hypothetical protein [Listeria booriae]